MSIIRSGPMSIFIIALITNQLKVLRRAEQIRAAKSRASLYRGTLEEEVVELSPENQAWVDDYDSEE